MQCSGDNNFITMFLLLNMMQGSNQGMGGGCLESNNILPLLMIMMSQQQGGHTPNMSGCEAQ